MQLSVIIPAYNEESTIQHTLAVVDDFLCSQIPDSEIIVVDDGSTDTTLEHIYTRDSVTSRTVLHHGNNKGKGAAVRTGIMHSQGQIVMFMDADLSADIKEYGRLKSVIDQGADIAIGSRYLEESYVAIHQPRVRMMMGRVANYIIRLLLLPGIHDTQCGFKVLKRDVALKLASLQTINGWSFDMELLVYARRLGYVIKEVPIHWAHSSRQSRFRSLRDLGSIILDMVRILWYLDHNKKIR